MRKSYRGFEIDVRRERCLGGWPLLYYRITREHDGYEAVCSFEDSAERVLDKINQLKSRVDAELLEADPWGEGEEFCGPLSG